MAKVPLKFNPLDKRVRKLLLECRVKKLSLFGSYARGKAGKNSDIDLLVDFGEGADLFDLIGLKQGLEKILGKKVDVVTRASLSKYIRDSVIESAITIYE